MTVPHRVRLLDWFGRRAPSSFGGQGYFQSIVPVDQIVPDDYAELWAGRISRAAVAGQFPACMLFPGAREVLVQRIHAIIGGSPIGFCNLYNPTRGYNAVLLTPSIGPPAIGETAVGARLSSAQLLSGGNTVRPTVTVDAGSGPVVITLQGPTVAALAADGAHAELIPPGGDFLRLRPFDPLVVQGLAVSVGLEVSFWWRERDSVLKPARDGFEAT